MQFHSIEGPEGACHISSSHSNRAQRLTELVAFPTMLKITSTTKHKLRIHSKYPSEGFHISQPPTSLSRYLDDWFKLMLIFETDLINVERGRYIDRWPTKILTTSGWFSGPNLSGGSMWVAGLKTIEFRVTTPSIYINISLKPAFIRMIKKIPIHPGWWSKLPPSLHTWYTFFLQANFWPIFWSTWSKPRFNKSVSGRLFHAKQCMRPHLYFSRIASYYLISPCNGTPDSVLISFICTLVLLAVLGLQRFSL